MPFKLAPPQRVLIIGGGEFGAVTALELAKGPFKDQAHLITILDRSATPPAVDAASYDLNKIVRQEYSDRLYAKLAHKSILLWRNDPDWKDNYHESGIVVSVRKDNQRNEYVQRSLEANSMPGMENPGLEARVLPERNDVEGVYPPQVVLGDFADESVYVNEAGGWAYSRGATEAAIARCRAAGVTFKAGTAKHLLIDQDKKCVLGVETESGDQHYGDKVIVACGAWTPTLVPELKVECLPTGQVAGMIQLTNEEYERYKNVPVTRLIDNGFYIFPPSETGIVKFALHQKGYLNPTDNYPSLPRTVLSRGYEFQRVPDDARQQLLVGLNRIYPELAAKPWHASRLCWYSDRPNGDWLLDYHPDYNETLFVAAGCCGHGFKFMPVLGGLIHQSLEGRLPPEYADIWAWVHRRPERRDESRTFSERKRLEPDFKTKL